MAEAAPQLPLKSTARQLLMPRNDIPGVENFAQISPALYRGAQPTAAGFIALKAMGVKTVVNLRSYHNDRKLLVGTGLGYFHLRCAAWRPTDARVAQFIKLMNDADNHPVFVHCQHGADRTGTMVAAYRIVTQNWNCEDAASEIYHFGYHKIFTKVKTYLKNFDVNRMADIVRETAAPKLQLFK